MGDEGSGDVGPLIFHDRISGHVPADDPRISCLFHEGPLGVSDYPLNAKNTAQNPLR